ncbi:MAG: hypothetical protein KDC24_06735 [Saprospiraceae bacterium]|nr:hypothetical protein [Saprospiraceae bacterium]
MTRKNRFSALFVIALSSLFWVACDKDDSMPNDPSDDVFELAVRKINPGVDINEFTTARDAFVAKLIAEECTSNDREFQPFFDFLNAGFSFDSVYIGMTQYEDLATYSALGNTLGNSLEAQQFFSLFSPLVFEALLPIEGYGPVDLSQIAPLGTGQVLEIAVRDLSAYASFDQADYETKRDAFLNKLSAQNGFLREIQWKSILNEDIVVGMTVYESQQAVIGINSDSNFTNSPEVVNFISTYPPTVFGTLNNVLK